MSQSRSKEQQQSAPGPGDIGPQPISRDQLHQALAEAVESYLRPVAGGLALLYLLIALGHGLMLEPPMLTVMLPLALGSAWLLGLTWWLALHRRIQRPWVFRVGLVIAALVLVNSLTHLYLSGEPWQTTNLMLLIIVAGIFLLSTVKYVVFTGFVVVSWYLVTVLAQPSPLWIHFGFALLMSVLLGVLIHWAHIANLRRMEGLRLSVEQHNLELRHQASHDALTGLVNRREFEQRLERSVADAWNSAGVHTLCYLDLDQFKLVNDTVGHTAGDEVLRQLAVLLLSRVRSRDTLARLGGDEFAMLLEHCPADIAVDICHRLVETLRGFRFRWDGRVFEIGVSIGVVAITRDTESAGVAMAHADVACYTAKDLGRGRVHVYQARDLESTRRHNEMLRATTLREALAERRFELYFQPILPLAAPDPALHFEVLLRLADGQGGVTSAGAFLPAAERYGLMPDIDRLVIDLVLEQAAPLLARNPNSRIGINLSGASLRDGALLDFVRQRFAHSPISPHRLCFEITETVAIDNLSQAARFIREMKTLGCRFALDDFGSGLASFHYLKEMPVEFLKIDGGFINHVRQDPVDEAMVAAIVQVGRVMGLYTIAECAQQGDLALLRGLGVDYVQGFDLGTPRPLAVLLADLDRDDREGRKVLPPSPIRD